jgi:alpha-beta hydrolase superfamily lysophospholipase
MAPGLVPGRSPSSRRRLRAAGRPTVGAVTVVVVMALVVSACGGPPATSSPSGSTKQPTGLDAFYRTPDPLVAAPPGTMIRSEKLPASADPGVDANVYRVLYHSRSITGKDIAVSGVIAVPRRAPASGGYPIVTWAHATTGIADSCAPSRQPSPSIGYLQSWIDAGYVVAATDYEGLGTAGIHPYLLGESEGRSVLDAARAARHFVGSRASDSVIIEGHSQGGHAALFAGQLAHTYAPDLHVVGTVALAPVSTVAALAPAVPGPDADAGSPITIMALAAWSKVYTNMPLGLALTPASIKLANATIDTDCAFQVSDEFSDTPTDQIFRPGWSTNPIVAAHMAANDPGGTPTESPVLVVQGTADLLIIASTTESMVNERLCAGQHDTVQLALYQGDDHGTILTDSQAMVAAWVRARLAGAPATNTCGRLPTVYSASGL